MCLSDLHIRLMPGNGGNDCPGNGKHIGQNGLVLECCCDECNYYLCCYGQSTLKNCGQCKMPGCPRRDSEQ